MAKNLSNSYPTSIQPKSAEKPLETNTLSNLSNSPPKIGWSISFDTKMAQGTTIGFESDRLDRFTSVNRAEPPPTVVRKTHVALNETGTQRIGEDHPRAKLSDAEVERMRDLYEAAAPGEPGHVGYRALAKLFNCSKRTVRDICNYSKRNQWVARWKRV